MSVLGLIYVSQGNLMAGARTSFHQLTCRGCRFRRKESSLVHLEGGFGGFGGFWRVWRVWGFLEGLGVFWVIFIVCVASSVEHEPCFCVKYRLATLKSANIYFQAQQSLQIKFEILLSKTAECSVIFLICSPKPLTCSSSEL